MNTKRRFIIMLALGVAGLATVFTISVAGPARNDERGERDRREFNALPPGGIATGQTLHVNFLNVSSNPLEIIPCVLDGDGVDVKEGTTITLAPGQMRSFDVSRSEVGERTDVRVQLRAIVHIYRRDLRNLAVTGEVIDEGTGKSSLFVPGARVGFDPQPDPPSPN